MQRVETVGQRIGLALTLGPDTLSVAMPSYVSNYVARARPWHIVIWSDDESGTAGIWNNSASISFHHFDLTDLSIEFVRPAKGGGYVALEARTSARGPATYLLRSESFNPDSLDWLVEHKIQISEVFGHAVSINDRGYDC